MERYFVRFPEGQVHTDVGPAFKLEPEHTTNFFAENNRSVILAALSDQQRNDIISAGGEVFEDYQFFPALDEVHQQSNLLCCLAVLPFFL